MELLEKLCRLPGPSGHEAPVTAFLLDYVRQHQDRWRCRPQIVAGPDFQDCLLLVFGTPRTALFAHLDTVGYTVRYDNKLVPIGGPDAPNGTRLVGHDRHGAIEATLVADAEGHILCVDFPRQIEPGTELLYKPHFRQDKTAVQCCYLDNRLGVWNALRVAETLEHGAIAFSCWEEHGGGSVPYLVRYLYETHGIRQALISDITWVTEGVRAGAGVAISLRDRYLPRRAFLERIIAIAEGSGVAYQLEVEGSGGSDGKEVQLSPYPIDWCFVGAPEQHVHTPDERVHKADIEAMVRLYEVLMRTL